MVYNQFFQVLFLVFIMSFLSGACAQDKSAAKVAGNAISTGGQRDSIVLGMGCFWGAEKRMSEIAGVVGVESGYSNGEVEARYESVLAHEQALRSGKSVKRNHAEVVKVTFDPLKVDLETVLIKFWESHNPTQGDRQGNDVGTNYRSAIYTHNEAQRSVALKTQAIYQQALTQQGFGKITTEIAALKDYHTAEDYHQGYLKKNPGGYCGLGGTGVAYSTAHQAVQPDRAATPQSGRAASPQSDRAAALQLDGKTLDFYRQLVVFEAPDCAYCKKFKADVLDRWQAAIVVVRTLNPKAPSGWQLEKALFATPTIVLFEKGREVSRFTGYNGETSRFWQWLGFQLLTPEQQKIAFEQGTEPPHTGSHLDEKRPGNFVDPITGVALFRSDRKYESGTGWPSFFSPFEGAVTLHEDTSHGTKRTEVRSASSGIHLGHVFDDGLAPTFKRYCINGNVLKFVPD